MKQFLILGIFISTLYGAQSFGGGKNQNQAPAVDAIEECINKWTEICHNGVFGPPNPPNNPPSLPGCYGWAANSCVSGALK